MSHHKLYSAFMSDIQDEVFIIFVFYKFGVHTINIKGLIYKFEYTQHDIVSNNQSNLIENINPYQIYQWGSALLCFSLGHQSYTNQKIKYACCTRFLLNFY